MNKRMNISSGTEWEEIVGYSRAVRIGNVVEVSGTTAVDGSEIVSKGSMEGQTRFIFSKIEKALQACGATLEDVVRTRMYITDISKWEEAARIHGEYFGKVKPAATMVEVSRLIDPDLLIEIEATAVMK